MANNRNIILHAPDTLPTEFNEKSRALHRKTHQTIRKVTRDLENDFHFNTAISAVMELVNLLFALLPEESDHEVAPEIIKEAVNATLLLLYPMTPHFCSELWQITAKETHIEDQSWPVFDAEAAREEEITIVLQVNGKVRGRLLVAPDIEDTELEKRALQNDKVQKFIAGKPIRKVIVVPKKLVNLVA